jgi:alkanesulfonate monooxygenase SsuD/methylene tetrahydromethanopterin reductase-like flavin-dependent oxidoreductase (luciferase family)
MEYGTALPHRSIWPLTAAEVAETAQTAEAFGFADLWVTDNTLDQAYSFDPFVVLTYAAALTNRIRLGISMLIVNTSSPVHVAHQAASLDVLSGGRLTLGVALGSTAEYHEFGVPSERPVRRLTESVEVIRGLWAEPQLRYVGEIFQLGHTAGDVAEPVSMSLTPVQVPRPPIWMGGASPGALKRAVDLSDGWMGSGGQTTAAYATTVAALQQQLELAGRDPAGFPISKRVFVSVADTEAAARAELAQWFGGVYGSDQLTDTAGIYGTPEQVAEKIHEFDSTGANHLLLNPMARYRENVEMLARAIAL